MVDVGDNENERGRIRIQEKRMVNRKEDGQQKRGWSTKNKSNLK